MIRPILPSIGRTRSDGPKARPALMLGEHRMLHFL